MVALFQGGRNPLQKWRILCGERIVGTTPVSIQVPGLRQGLLLHAHAKSAGIPVI